MIKLDAKKMFRALVRMLGVRALEAIIEVLVDEIQDKLGDEIENPGNDISQDFVDTLANNKPLIVSMTRKLF